MRKIILLLIIIIFIPIYLIGNIIYSNNFESDSGGLVIATNSKNMIWEWGEPKYVGPDSAYSGTKCWGTIVQGNYGGTTNYEFLVITNIDLTSESYAYLSFQHYYKFDNMGSDGGHLQVSTNNGTNYILLGDYPYYYPYNWVMMLDTGPGFAYDTKGTNWQNALFDLTKYVGKKINIRFRFETDAWDNNFPGWYIDDLVIKNTPIPVKGTGICTNDINTVYNNTTNTITFVYTAYRDMYNKKITIEIPGGWSAPQDSNSAVEGYIQVTGGVGSPKINTDPIISSQTITIEITNMQAGNTINIVYGAGSEGVISPNTFGIYTFIVKSGGTEEGLSTIGESPVIVVQPKITPPYTEDFESNSGGFYQSGNYNQWEYGVPSSVGPSTAHSGSYCWGTKINDYYGSSSFWDERLNFPPIDLTSVTTNVYLSFWVYWDFYYNYNSMHDGVVIKISTNGGSSFFIAEAKYGTEYNDESSTPPFWPPSSPYCWSMKQSSWKHIYIDLTDFNGKIIKAYFEFAVQAMDSTGTYAGFYIDDIEVKTGGIPIAGSGNCSISPITTYPTSTNKYVITYKSERVIHNGKISIDIPAGWTAPQKTTPANPGYIRVVSTNANNKINNVPDIVGNTVTIYITNMYGSDSFNVIYSNAVSQNSTGSALFSVKSALNTETLTSISSPPSVEVLPIISTFDWSKDFESDNGLLYSGDNFWEWGTPTVGPSSAYSGTKCWGTLLSDNITPDYKIYNLYTPYFNLSNLTNIIIDFMYYANLPNEGYFGAQILISTNYGNSFSILGKYPTDYDYKNFYWDNSVYQPGWAASTSGWEKKVIDLAKYSKKTVQLKFRFINKGWNNSYAGFYIDNIAIKKGIPPIAGTGSGEISPNVSAPNVESDYEITYTAAQNFYNGKVAIKIPSDWTEPRISSGPGHVEITSVLSNAKINNSLTISGSGPWTITVTVTNISAEGGFVLAYSNATAPTVTGVSIFTMKSALNSETLTSIENSPQIAILNTVSVPFTYNFDSDNGGLVQIGSTHNLWAWGIPSWGPSSAHSGSRLWATVLNDNFQEKGVYDKLTTPIIDLTSASYAHLSFYQWYQFGDTMSGDNAGNVMISTNFKDFVVLGSSPKNYPTSWTFSWLSEKSGEPGYTGWDWDTQQKWEKRVFNLADYVGKKIILRFDFSSSPSVWNRVDFPGWYIDDLSVKPTPPPIAGTGSASIYPETAIVGTTNNYSIQYTAKEDIVDGRIEIKIPEGWSSPQTNNTTGAGYFYLETYSSFSYNIQISNTYRIIINVQNLDYNEYFYIKYRNVTPPSTPGSYTFTNKSAGNNETLTAIDNLPRIIVQEIQYLPYEEEFDDNNGGWLADGNNNLFEWGKPSTVGPSTAHSGEYCWGTRIDGFYNINNAWEYLVSPPIDATAETQVYLTFYQYYETEADEYKNSGDGVYLEIAVADSLSELSSSSFNKVGSYPQTYNQSFGGNEFWGGQSGGWVRQEINLSQYKGKFIKLRFYFQSDMDYSSLPGWYIDDIRITPTVPKQPTVLFEDSAQHIGNNNTYGVNLIDFDNDGDFDLIANNYNQSYNIIWKNSGDGSLSQFKSLGKNSTFVMRFADFNNDGFIDAFAGNSKGEGDNLLEQPNEIFINNEGKEFSLLNNIGNDITRDVALGDIDNDGDIDIFVANIGANSIYINDGTGSFSEKEILLPGNNTTACLFFDVNKDGYIDLIIGNNDGEANRLMLNDGRGSLIDSEQSLGKYDTTSIAAGDIDEDGDIDIIFGTTTLIRIWTNGGNTKFGKASDSMFQPRNISYLTNTTRDLKLADVDNDGDLDIIAGNKFDTDMVWLNSGYSFKDSGNYLGSFASEHISVADFNKDGFLDFAVGNSSEQFNVIWLNKMTNGNINKRPTKPSSFDVEFQGNNAILTWQDGSDTETPKKLLTYNLKVGTTPGGNEILSVPYKSDNYYYNSIGNIGTGKVEGSKHTYIIKNLSKISYYYFYIQTVDSGFLGSEWARVIYYHDRKAPEVDDFKTADNFLNLNNNEGCIISYNLSKDSKVTIEIVNLEGVPVKTLLDNEQKTAGYNQSNNVIWYGKNSAGNKVAPGIYWIRVHTDSWTKMKKVLIVW